MLKEQSLPPPPPPKKNLSVIIYSLILFQTLYWFHYYVEHYRSCFNECICCFCPYNEQHRILLTFNVWTKGTETLCKL